jgi:hypothetical protein
MKKPIVVALCGVLGLAAVALAAPRSRTTARQARPSRPELKFPGHIPVPDLTPALPTPDRAPVVVAEPNAPVIHHRAATILHAAGLVPAYRAAKFAWLARDGHRVIGWHSTIQDVTGTRVTVRVGPVLAPGGGSSITVVDHAIEQYELAGPVPAFIGVANPAPVPVLITD